MADAPAPGAAAAAGSPPSLTFSPSSLRFSAASFRTSSAFAEAAGAPFGETAPSSGPMTRSTSSPVSSAPAAGSGSGAGSPRMGRSDSGLAGGGVGLAPGARSSFGRDDAPGGGAGFAGLSCGRDDAPGGGAGRAPPLDLGRALSPPTLPASLLGAVFGRSPASATASAPPGTTGSPLPSASRGAAHDESSPDMVWCSSSGFFLLAYEGGGKGKAPLSGGAWVFGF